MSAAERFREAIESAKREFEAETGAVITRVEVQTITGFASGKGEVSWIESVKVETLV